jgi:hypothetical protein
MRPLLVPLLALSVGCVTVRELEEASFEGPITLLSADHGRGDLDVFGVRSGTDVNVDAWVWGRGSRRDRADARQDRVTWTAEVVEQELALSSFAADTRAGVDFVVEAPRVIDTVIRLDNGRVTFDRVEGVHDVVADSVRGTVTGDLFVTAESSIDLDFIPYETTEATLDSGGSVTLALPPGLDYDLIIRAEPDDAITVDELGFDDVRLGEGFFAGYRGWGAVRINIFARGSVTVTSLR